MSEQAEYKNLLLIGASGKTGAIIARLAKQFGYQAICPSHQDLPLEEMENLSNYIIKQAADLLINCAAISDVEQCGKDPVLAHTLNAMAPAAMAAACKHVGTRFIHLSTDYVLDGRKAGFKDESSKCHPINLYAASKEEGEAQIMDAWSDSIICRVSWVCGNPAKLSFIESNCARAMAGEKLAAVADKYSMPTHAEDIARICFALAGEEEARGIVHLCSHAERPLSWWDCACMAMEELVKLGVLDTMPEIEEQRFKDFSVGRDPRPVHTAMECRRLKEWGIATSSARDSIARAVRRYVEYLSP